jgi:hypothetical protein
MVHARFTALLVGALFVLPAAAQSGASAQASAISLAPSVEVASIALEALPAGSNLVVRGVEVVGESVFVTVAASAEAASFVVELTASAIAAAGLVVGATVSVVVVSGGFLLVAAGEALCFIPDAATRALIHHRQVSP